MDWIDAVVGVYNGLGFINANTFSSYRSEVNREGAAIALAQFDALQVNLGALPEAAAPLQEAQLLDLRDERDEINNAMDRLDALIAAEPAGTVGRLVKDILRDGKRLLRQHKQAVRDQIQNITGDPDST